MKENSRKIIMTVLVIFSLFIVGTISQTFLVFITNDTVRTLSGNFIYLIILIYIYRNEFKSSIEKIKEKGIKENLKTGFKYWGLGILGMIVFNIIINFIIFDGTIAKNEELVRETMFGNPIFGFISAVAFAPFIEEIVFRISLRRNIKNKYIYAFMTALLFGFAHALSGYTHPLDLLYILPYGSLGYAFGMMYVKTENAYTSIFIHALHNLITTVLLFTVIG